MHAIHVHQIERLRCLQEFVHKQWSSIQTTLHEDKDSGTSFLAIEVYKNIQLCILVNWRTAKWELELRHKDARFKTKIFDSRLLSLKQHTFEINANINKLVDVVDYMKRALVLHAYCRAASLLGLECHTVIDEGEQNIEIKSKIVEIDQRIAKITFPEYQNVFIIVSVTEDYEPKMQLCIETT